ncbi:MAG TPA: TPM domain-containing protein [Azospira sp.]|nr:TPM domain-containing protein [Azospira sp.]
MAGSGLRRFLRYLLVPEWLSRRRFPAAALARVEAAIGASEREHEGELRFVLEGCLPLEYALRPRGCRARALALFGDLRVWDTVHNSGVLIYLDLLDRQVEIVADRGIHARVEDGFWEQVCRRMEVAFQSGDFEGGTLQAIAEITAVLHQHFPALTANANELPDAPLVL